MTSSLMPASLTAFHDACALVPWNSGRVDPNEMVQYVQNLMTTPQSANAPETTMALAHRQWGGDTPLARAAQLRWSALNRAFGDARVSTWTTHPKRDQIHVPAALIALSRQL